MNRDVVNSYTKRPIQIEAIQFNGVNVELIREFTGGKMSAFHRKNNRFYINTLEGLMLVNVGDYIIRGVAGEYYSCREDIFNLTYEDYKNGDAEIIPQLRGTSDVVTQGF